MQFLTENSYFPVGKFKQLAFLWELTLLHFGLIFFFINHESKYITNLIKVDEIDDFTVDFHLLTTFVPLMMVVNLVRLFLKISNTIRI